MRHARGLRWVVWAAGVWLTPAGLWAQETAPPAAPAPGEAAPVPEAAPVAETTAASAAPAVPPAELPAPAEAAPAPSEPPPNSPPPPPVRQAVKVPILAPAPPPPPAIPSGPVSGGPRVSVAVPTVDFTPFSGAPYADEAALANWEPPPETPPLPRLTVLEGRYYEVAAPDFPSAQTVKRMAERLENVVAGEFTWPRDKVRPIQVHLVPAAEAKFAEPFSVLQDENAHSAVLVRWGPDTRYGDVCLALASATVEQFVAWSSGPAAAKRSPDWLKFAYAQALEANLRPALGDGLAEQAAFLPALSLRQIMTARGPYTEDVRAALAVNSYWLARFLAEESGGAARTRALFAALAAGASPPDALRVAFPNKFPDPATLELWWSLGYRNIIARRGFPVQTLTQSRDTLEHLHTLEQVVNNKKESGSLDAAWAARRNPAVRDEVAARVQELRPLLTRINPVYHNALLSVGDCLRALQGNDEAAFRAAWKQYVKDLAAADAVENQVLEALAR